jgi:hypothetical protein
MEMTSATAMMTSFSPKTSQTNSTSSGFTASSRPSAVNSASVSSQTVSATPAPQISSPSSATPIPVSSSSAAIQVSTPISPKVAQAPSLPKSASVDSPQFSLKQGAMSVQGLLGHESFSSNKLETVSSGTNSTASASSKSISNRVTASITDAPSTISQTSTTINTQVSAAQPEQGNVSDTIKPSVAENFASIFGDGASEQRTVTEESTDEGEVQVQESGQSQVDASLTDESNAKQAQTEQDVAKQQRQDAIRQQEQQSAQKAELAQAAQINQLSKRDAEVKSHEQAHASVGGAHAQSPSFTYEKGPDGRRYAVDGEVQIDVSVVNGDAQATLNKMMKVYAAAMAPVQPSMADIRVAAEALQKMNEAREELSIERQQGVIKLDDADHIIGLGAKIKNAQDDNQVSQLEPFKRSANEANISVDGIEKTSDTSTGSVTNTNVQSNATLAYQAFNAGVTRQGQQESNINAYV